MTTFTVTYYPTNPAESRFAVGGSFGETAEEAVVEYLVGEGADIDAALDAAGRAEIIITE